MIDFSLYKNFQYNIIDKIIQRLRFLRILIYQDNKQKFID